MSKKRTFFHPQSIIIFFLLFIGALYLIPWNEVLSSVSKSAQPPAHAGMNLFIQNNQYYDDMVIANETGAILRRWKLLDPVWRENELRKQYPELRFIGEVPAGKGQSLYQIELTGDGSRYANFKFTSIVRIDPQGNYEWVSWGAYHHDIAVTEDGERIYSFRRKFIELPDAPSVNVKVDDLAVLNAAGEVVKEVDLFTILKPHLRMPPNFLDPVFSLEPDPALIHHDGKNDIMHCNSVDIIRYVVPDVAVPGDLVLSCAAPGIIAILDAKSFELKWIYHDPEIFWQHDASVTSDGNVLFLDNKYGARTAGMGNASRAVMVNPQTNQIVWQFFREGWDTATKGTVEELPNGNLQILYAKSGVLIELTTDKQVVSAIRLEPEDSKRSDRLKLPVNRCARVPEKVAEMLLQ